MFTEILTINTRPYDDQSFGTSGIRKSVKTFNQKYYLHNILFAIFQICEIKNKSIILGGDGRFFNKTAILTALQMLIAAKAKRVVIGLNGWFSTPAVSCYIKKYNLDYGIIFSASHNPAGENGDFGIKVNGNNGSPINEKLCEQIYEYTKKIHFFTISNKISFDIHKIQSTKILDTDIAIVDPVKDYVTLMENIFNFDSIQSLFNNKFSMLYEGYNAISGIYAKEIFCNKLNVSTTSLQNVTPLEDFGKYHADPNSLYAKHLIEKSHSEDSPDILFASDGDADRNMIIGKNMVVAPSDSLSAILLYANLIPYYRDNVIGVARSMPTSQAVDKVAKYLNIQCYEVPTGWKYFGSLLENKLITFCGEESYGTGSIHCGEKDGIWAMLFWLNILAETKRTVKDIINDLWLQFGRYVFLRLDYCKVDNILYNHILCNIDKLNNLTFNNSKIKVTNFNYTDPITSETVYNKGNIITCDKNNRIIIRTSGTESSNLTLRVYLEKYIHKDSTLLNQNSLMILDDLFHLVSNKIFHQIKKADLIDLIN